MNGVIAQTAALAAHARARRLDVALGGDEAYWARHSTFQYVRTLRFVTRRGLLRSREVVAATTPPAWMATFPADADVSFLSLGASGPLEPHMAVAFAGGTQEAIAVAIRGSAVLWIPAWEVVAEHPDTRIWAVDYCTEKGRGLKAAPRSVERSRENLARALRRIAEFASSDPGLSFWRTTFDEAVAALAASKPVAPYHPDLLPPDGYSLPARQLLAASVRAFVFGGMGSWNDSGFEDRELQDHYVRVTRELYVAVMDGLAAAVNDGLSSS